MHMKCIYMYACSSNGDGNKYFMHKNTHYIILLKKSVKSAKLKVGGVT